MQFYSIIIMAQNNDFIVIKGATENSLKNLILSIPKRQITVAGRFNHGEVADGIRHHRGEVAAQAERHVFVVHAAISAQIRPSVCGSN